MHRFKRSGRKTKDIPEPVMEVNDDIEPTSFHDKVSKTLKRKVKQPQDAEVAPQLDLGTALPLSDEFRTSLIMPQLSARFSMLREQDDPTTKIGKASDDSVLFPNHPSRVPTFLQRPLADISEVDSIYTPVRLPFADDDQASSYSDGYQSDEYSSIMSRGRPVEQNNLSGHRIPTQRSFTAPTLPQSAMLKHPPLMLDKSATLLTSPSSSTSRPLQSSHSPTVRASTTRRLAEFDFSSHQDSEVINSPSTVSDQDRTTTSSLVSAPSNRRASTAATSVTSDSLGQTQIHPSVSEFSDQLRQSDIESHSGEAQSQTFNPSPEERRGFFRTEKSTLTSSPAPSTGGSSFTQSSMANSGHSNMGTPDTTRSTLFETQTGSGKKLNTISALPSPCIVQEPAPLFSRPFRTHSPIKQGMLDQSDEQSIFTRSVQPNDVGKATAMGLFNRPKQQFDEETFMKRQMQMHQNKAQPQSDGMALETQNPVVNSQAETTKTIDNIVSSLNSSYPIAIQPINAINMPSPSPTVSRNRSPIEAQSSSWPLREPYTTTTTTGLDIRARAEALISRQNVDHSTNKTAAQKSSSRKVEEAPTPKNTKFSINTGSSALFLDDSDVSDTETDYKGSGQGSTITHSQPSLTEVHPALRNGLSEFRFNDMAISDQTSGAPAKTPPSIVVPQVWKEEVIHDVADPQPPLFEATQGLGLSGLIRSHLRHDSDRSSFRGPSPTRAADTAHSRSRGLSAASSSRTAGPAESVRSDPWELERPQAALTEHDNCSVASDLASPSSQKSLPQINRELLQKPLPAIAPENRENNSIKGPELNSWQDELVPSHRRGESSETQKESEELDNKLAERARKIQQSLKSSTIPEQEPRLKASSSFQNLPAQALSVLKHKTSRSGVALRQNDSAVRASKTVASSVNSSSTPSTRDGENPPNDFSREKQQSDLLAQRAKGFSFFQDNNEVEEGQRASAFQGSEPSNSRSSSRQEAGRTNRYYRQEDGGAVPQPLREPSLERAEPGDLRRPSVSSERSEASSFSGRYRSASRGRLHERLENRPPANLAPITMTGGGIAHRRPSPLPTVPQSPMVVSHPHTSPTIPTVTRRNVGPSLEILPPMTSPMTNVAKVTPSGTRRKHIAKDMISEPKLISTTSTVMLVELAKAAQNPIPAVAPPIPAMNPRRRNNQSPENFSTPIVTILDDVANHKELTPPFATKSHIRADDLKDPITVAKHSGRLRKISSEGGSMAAKARLHAMMLERGREVERSPGIPMFPNRSATALNTQTDGTMF